MGSNDRVGVLRCASAGAELQYELCVFRRRQRRYRFGQRFDLHSARHVGNEFQAVDRQRPDVLARRSGGRFRGADSGRRLPELASRSVRSAQRRVPADRQPRRFELDPGRVRIGRRQAAQRPDPAGHHQFRQPAQSRLGRRTAPGEQSDPDDPVCRLAGPSHLQPANAERKPDLEAAADVSRDQ